MIWQVVNYQFCSFKSKIAEEQTFCRYRRTAVLLYGVPLTLCHYYHAKSFQRQERCAGITVVAACRVSQVVSQLPPASRFLLLTAPCSLVLFCQLCRRVSRSALRQKLLCYRHSSASLRTCRGSTLITYDMLIGCLDSGPVRRSDTTFNETPTPKMSVYPTAIPIFKLSV